MEAVLAIHAEVLAAHGGGAGVRDRALLESAVAAPRASFAGEPLLSNAIEIGAAYLYYLCRNHPFVDGNKRVGAHACILFLLSNDVEPIFTPGELVDVTLAVARGEVSAEALAIWLRQRSRHQER